MCWLFCGHELRFSKKYQVTVWVCDRRVLSSAGNQALPGRPRAAARASPRHHRLHQLWDDHRCVTCCFWPDHSLVLRFPLEARRRHLAPRPPPLRVLILSPFLPRELSLSALLLFSSRASQMFTQICCHFSWLSVPYQIFKLGFLFGCDWPQPSPGPGDSCSPSCWFTLTLLVPPLPGYL